MAHYHIYYILKFEGSVDELVEAYNKGVQSIINHHAPSCSKIITLRPEASWYTDYLRSAKKISRKQKEPGTELP